MDASFGDHTCFLLLPTRGRTGALTSEGKMKLYKVQLIAMALVLFAVVSSRAHAQGNPTGTLAGTVSDPSGAMLPGVAVAAKAEHTGLTQTTVSRHRGRVAARGAARGYV